MSSMRQLCPSRSDRVNRNPRPSVAVLWFCLNPPDPRRRPAACGARPATGARPTPSFASLPDHRDIPTRPRIQHLDRVRAQQHVVHDGEHLRDRPGDVDEAPGDTIREGDALKAVLVPEVAPDRSRVRPGELAVDGERRVIAGPLSLSNFSS